MLFKLGSKAKDTLTGYRGTVVHISQHIGGLTQYELQAPLGSDGKWTDSKWFSENRLAAVKGDKVEDAPAKKKAAPSEPEEAPETDEATNPEFGEEEDFGQEAEEPEAEPEATMDEVVLACQAHAKKTSRAKTNEILLKKFKITSVKQLKSTQFAAVIAAMQLKK